MHKTQEKWIQFLGWEDPLEESMATHSSILAWRIPWTEEPGRLQSMGSQRVGHDRMTELGSHHWGKLGTGHVGCLCKKSHDFSQLHMNFNLPKKETLIRKAQSHI